MGHDEHTRPSETGLSSGHGSQTLVVGLKIVPDLQV